MIVTLPSGKEAEFDEPSADTFLHLNEERAVLGARVLQTGLYDDAGNVIKGALGKLSEDQARLAQASGTDLTAETIITYLVRVGEETGPFTKEWLMKLKIRDYNALAKAAEEFNKEITDPKA